MEPGVDPDRESGNNFVRTIVRDDLAAGKYDGIVTRFPPEPNGFLHIGHAKAICVDFGIAAEFGGYCNLRFDDTNPATEDPRYVDAIKADVRWLGFDWGAHEYYASDYFERLYDWAVELIRKGRAYVDDLTEEEIRAYRGTVTKPGRESPYRARSAAENLDLFTRMRAGEFPDGAKVLRARIDMAHSNMKMRDPLMYRIRHAHHYRRGDEWCIYPFYDWAHGQSDAIEGVTHSLCTLEFVNNRELYDWYIESLDLDSARPYQFEFSRLNVDYTITSKRKLLQLVEGGHVDGWDDPRMPTIAGLRRRGVTPAAIRNFCDLVGVAKTEGRVDIAMLEYAIRDDLNHEAPRMMCVLRPLKVVVTNWPAGKVEQIDAPLWPHDVPKEGSRPVPFGGELYIEREDFMEQPPPKFFRLAPGREVRLRYGYVIRCDDVVKDDSGEVVELRCSYDPETSGGSTPDGRRVKGTVHWVSAEHAVSVSVRLYDRLFAVADPGRDGDLIADLNPDSLNVLEGALAEPTVAKTMPGTHLQFERQGYFFSDPVDSEPGTPIFNRVVTLRDSWTKALAADQPAGRADAPGGAAVDGEPVSAIGTEYDHEGRKRRKHTPAEARAAARDSDPDLASRYERYRAELGLSAADADVLTGYPALADFFEAAVAAPADAAATAKWIVNEVLPATKERRLDDLLFDGGTLGTLVAMVETGEITARAGRLVFELLVAEGGDPHAIVRLHGLDAVVDEAALAAVVDRVVADNPDKVDEYRAGREALIGFFMGRVMAEVGAGADGGTVQRLLRERLAG